MGLNKPEQKAVLAENLSRYRGHSYAELRALVESKEVDACEVQGPSGAVYQIEILFLWDHKPHGNIRVLGSIDESPPRPLWGFIPIFISSVTDSFIMSPQGDFVGE